MFNVPSTARSFRDGTPIYCPLRRTWSSINTPFRPGIEPRVVAWQSITLPLRYASSTHNALAKRSYQISHMKHCERPSTFYFIVALNSALARERTNWTSQLGVCDCSTFTCTNLFVCLGLTSLLNIWGHIATMPTYSNQPMLFMHLSHLMGYWTNFRQPHAWKKYPIVKINTDIEGLFQQPKLLPLKMPQSHFKTDAFKGTLLTSSERLNLYYISSYKVYIYIELLTFLWLSTFD